MADKPLGQAYTEEVETLKQGGMSNADAIRTVASKYDKSQNTVRAGIHQFKSRRAGKTGGTSNGRRSRRPSALSVDDAVAGARQMLEQARAGVDAEIDRAKAELDAVQQRYDELVASAEERKRDLDAKIKALS